MGKTVVLGASLKRDRYSNLAINDLVAAGENVIGIGLQEGEVAGVRISKEMMPIENVDTITLYVSAKNQSVYYDYIIGLHPKRVIFNPGTRNKELEDLLIKNNIAFEHACTLVLLKTGQY
jgi:hypothetical protein